MSLSMSSGQNSESALDATPNKGTQILLALIEEV